MINDNVPSAAGTGLAINTVERREKTKHAEMRAEFMAAQITFEKFKTWI